MAETISKTERAKRQGLLDSYNKAKTKASRRERYSALIEYDTYLNTKGKLG